MKNAIYFSYSINDVYLEFHLPLVLLLASPQSQAAVAALAPAPFLVMVAADLPSPQLLLEAAGAHPLPPLEPAEEQTVQKQVMGLRQKQEPLLEQEGWQGSERVLGHP